MNENKIEQMNADNFIDFNNFILTKPFLEPSFDVITEESFDSLERRLQQMCRTCLSEKCSMKSLSSNENIDGKSISFINILMDFTNLQISCNDGKPHAVCKKCFQCAKFAYYFKIQCEKADNILQNILNEKRITGDEFESKDSKNNDSQRSLSDNNPLLIFNSNDETSIERKSVELDKCETNFQSNENSNDSIEPKEDAIKAEFMNDSLRKCSICFKNVRNIKQHMKYHTARIHTCEECGKSYSSHHDLRVHLTIHSTIRPYKCSICTKDFRHKFRLKEHMLGHEDKKEFICEHCGKRFNRAKELSTHKRVHTGVKPYNCNICNKNFVGSDTLTKHMKTHTGEKKHTCDFCLKSFVAKDQLKIHMRRHTGEKPYVCTMEGCNRKFSTIHSLNMHTPVHSNIRPFKCTICEKSFAREQDKRKHEAIHDRQYHSCTWSGCGRIYTCQASLKDHLATHSGEKRALCTHCGKSFSRKADLKRHILTHTQEKPFKCSHCEKGFNQQFGLTQHLRYHTGEACFICDLCGKGFMRKATLEKHKLVHAGIKNYKCEYCNRAFTINAHLIRHRRIHTGERPYDCDLCNKSFSARSGYVVHRRSHTGEKPYKCKFCEKTCATSTALKIHTRNHTGEKPYICSRCRVAFARSDLRTLHMRSCCPESVIELNQIQHEALDEFYDRSKDLTVSQQSLTILDSVFQHQDSIDGSLVNNSTNSARYLNVTDKDQNILISSNVSLQNGSIIAENPNIHHTEMQMKI